MSKSINLVVEPLSKSHDRPGFQCGVEALDQYLKRQAMQDIKRDISRVFVADAINQDARNFYRTFGFKPISDKSLRLFLPLQSTKGLKLDFPIFLQG